MKWSEVNVGGVACVLSVRALCLHSHETSLHASACDGLDQSGEVLLAEHLPTKDHGYIHIFSHDVDQRTATGELV